MNIIIFIIEVIFVALFLILSIILLPIGYLLRAINKNMSLSYASTIIRFVLKVIKLLSLTSFEVRYDEDIDNSKPHFYISNHRGIFDVILLYPLINGRCLIISKDKLKKYPLVAQWMELIGCYFLDRENMRSGFKMVVYSIEMLKKGVSVFIFPEGTRSKGENYVDMLEFKEGCFAIPKKANVDIIPIAIHDTKDIFEKNKMLSVGHKIYAHIGKASMIGDEDNVGVKYREIVRGLM